MPSSIAHTTGPEPDPRDPEADSPGPAEPPTAPGDSVSAAALIDDDSDPDHDPDMVPAIVNHLAGQWPQLPADALPALARDVLTAAVAFQDARAEELLNRVQLHHMGPTSSGGIEIVTSAPPEITAVFVSWAHAMLGPALNYVEQAFEFTSRATDERFTITVQRVGPGKLTPHEARAQAEKERDAHTEQVTDLRTRLDEVQQSVCAACRSALATTWPSLDE